MAYRSIWISDVHLGTRHAKVDALLGFLREHDSQYLYIVGDFIDGWALRSSWHWENSYNVLIQKLLRKSRKQTKVIYITGNHDEFLLQFSANRFGSLMLLERAIHVGPDHKRYLVIHGHQFDGLTHCNRGLERLGSHLYDLVLDLNHYVNRVGRRVGFGYWSFASYLKAKAKLAVKYVTDYELAMVQMARRSNVEGIICGHIHRPEARMMGNLAYYNCGDWVENCTALVEDFDGKIKLLRIGKNFGGVGDGNAPSRIEDDDPEDDDGTALEIPSQLEALRFINPERIHAGFATSRVPGSNR